MGKRKFKLLYSGKKVSELPYISEIFQSDKDGLYTKDALMFQDILRFSGDKVCFKRSELDNWLLRHNQELVNNYKDISTRNTPYSTRRANRKDRLDRIFNNLLDMKVVVPSGTTRAMKIITEVETFSINKSGKLILEIIRNMSLKNELSDVENNENQSLFKMKTKELDINYLKIYDLIISIFVVNDETPYRSSVFKELLINLQKKGLFFKFVDYISIIIHRDHITDIFQLVSAVLHFMVNRASESNQFIDLYYESANGLDSEGKKIFLYERKLHIEENIKNNSKGYSREYERQCFANRAEYDKIVLEVECNICKKSGIKILSHDEYRTLIQDIDVFGTRQGDIQKFDCTHCHSNDACMLLTF